LVALTIGLELKLSSLKKLGNGITWIIFAESFGAFILVFTAVFLYTKNMPLALVFAGIAPASAPAGTVAVIQEYRAKGPLTKSLYVIVGFDDGLGIIIFGFAAAIARSILSNQTGAETVNFFELIWPPLKEILISLAIGGGFSIIISLLVRKLENSSDILIILIGSFQKAIPERKDGIRSFSIYLSVLPFCPYRSPLFFFSVSRFFCRVFLSC